MVLIRHWMIINWWTVLLWVILCVDVALLFLGKSVVAIVPVVMLLVALGIDSEAIPKRKQTSQYKMKQLTKLLNKWGYDARTLQLIKQYQPENAIQNKGITLPTLSDYDTKYDTILKYGRGFRDFDIQNDVRYHMKRLMIMGQIRFELKSTKLLQMDPSIQGFVKSNPEEKYFWDLFYL